MALLNIVILCNLIYLVNLYEFGKLTVVSDLLPETCFKDNDPKNKNLNYVEADEHGLPKCQTFANKNDPCANYYDTKSTYFNTVSRPTCAKDGKFGPKQCKGQRATGRCFCFNAEGKRIFGQQWWSNADKMTCACSRRKADMQSKENIYFNSLHCNSVGNYEALQCDVISSQCWCADEMTGDLTSPVVPDKAKVKLPCYQSLTFGIQYLRQCESQKYAQEKTRYLLKLHGTSDVAFADLLCDDDGSYGAYKLDTGSAYCVWRDNKIIGPWQDGGDDRSTLTCNCARDSVIFDAAGKTLTQKCDGTGNYQQYQVSGTNTYCVDTDGYTKSTTGAKPNNETACKIYYSY